MEMNDDGPGHLAMDEAFCTRMCAAIAAGLETAPMGVTPLASSLGCMEF